MHTKLSYLLCHCIVMVQKNMQSIQIFLPNKLFRGVNKSFKNNIKQQRNFLEYLNSDKTLIVFPEMFTTLVRVINAHEEV